MTSVTIAAPLLSPAEIAVEARRLIAGQTSAGYRSLVTRDAGLGMVDHLLTDATARPAVSAAATEQVGIMAVSPFGVAIGGEVPLTPSGWPASVWDVLSTHVGVPFGLAAVGVPNSGDPADVATLLRNAPTDCGVVVASTSPAANPNFVDLTTLHYAPLPFIRRCIQLAGGGRQEGVIRLDCHITPGVVKVQRVRPYTVGGLPLSGMAWNVALQSPLDPAVTSVLGNERFAAPYVGGGWRATGLELHADPWFMGWRTSMDPSAMRLYWRFRLHDLAARMLAVPSLDQQSRDLALELQRQRDSAVDVTLAARCGRPDFDAWPEAAANALTVGDIAALRIRGRSVEQLRLSPDASTRRSMFVAPAATSADYGATVSLRGGVYSTPDGVPVTATRWRAATIRPQLVLGSIDVADRRAAANALEDLTGLEVFDGLAGTLISDLEHVGLGSDQSIWLAHLAGSPALAKLATAAVVMASAARPLKAAEVDSWLASSGDSFASPPTVTELLSLTAA